MALGISNVNLSYSTANEQCSVTVTGNYTIEYAGTYVISGCTLGATYICYRWGDSITVAVGDPATGSFTLKGLEYSGTEEIPGYDFYYTAGDVFDITLFSSTGSIVGIQKVVSMLECNTTTECTPGDQSCVGDDVYRCNTLGTAEAYVTTCGGNYYCDAGQCVPKDIPDDPDDPDAPVVSSYVTTILLGVGAVAGALLVAEKVM